MSTLEKLMVCLVVIFSLLLIAFGTMGAIGTIIADWRQHGPPFGCQPPQPSESKPT